MALLVVVNRITHAATVVVNLSKTRNGNLSTQTGKAMIDCLLLEKLPLAGIARVMNLSED
jgi:hypothetical protein